MHRPVLATLMLALLAACASSPTAPAEDPSVHATLEVIGHHRDGGQGVDGLAVHVDKPGIATIHWTNKNVCGDPA